MSDKSRLRRLAYDARNAQQDKDLVSRVAIQRLTEIPEYRCAQTILWYLDCRSELRTRDAVVQATTRSGCTVVPYCTVDRDQQKQLGLWRLNSIEELTIGQWKILEPPQHRRDEPDRIVLPTDIDLVIVPGVAFDTDGNRLGNGQGYYDRLLSQLRDDCTCIGLCYEAQVFEQVPTESARTYGCTMSSPRRACARFATDRLFLRKVCLIRQAFHSRYLRPVGRTVA